MDADKVSRAYARLLALKANLPKNTSIRDTFVFEYHAIVGQISKETGMSLEEFEIPLEQMKPEVVSITPTIPSIGQEGSVEYSREKYCDENYLRSKMDGLLNYLQFLLKPGEEAKKIGF